MGNTVGRKASAPGTKRPMVGARMDPALVRWLTAEQERTGESLGRVLDRAVRNLASDAAKVQDPPQ